MLEIAAICGVEVEPRLLEGVVDLRSGGLDECVDAGRAAASGGPLIAFRHDLVRAVVEASVTPRAVMLHQKILKVLCAQPVAEVEPHHVAYHAEAAGARTKLLTYAPQAAKRFRPARRSSPRRDLTRLQPQF